MADQMPPAAARSSTARLAALCAGMAAVTAALHVIVVRHVEPVAGAPRIPWWVLALLATAAAGCTVELQIRRQARSVGLGDLPIAIGLFAVSPLGLVFAQLAGAALALPLLRRQSMRKIVFNLHLAALLPSVALAVFHGLGADAGPRGWGAAVAALLAVGAVSGLLVCLAIACYGGICARDVAVTLGSGLVIGGVEACLGLVAMLVLAADARAGALLVATACVLYLAYRGYAALRERHENLGLLYEFTQRSERSPDFRSGIQAMLEGARMLLRSEVAEITLLPASGRQGMRVRLGPGERLVTSYDPPAGWPYDAVVADRRALLLRGDALHEFGCEEMLVAPLAGAAGVVGAIAVGDRMGDVRRFNGEDLRFFETVANHASISLENGYLVERLRHEALHDPLTGLPNRARFELLVEEAIENGSRLAVLLLDLDRLKDVNDTLGHHNGDELLREVAARLSATGRPAARLSGDVFAMLLLDPIDPVTVAREIIAVVERPFDVDGLTLDVAVGAGLSLHPADGHDAGTLVQRADVARDTAKARGTGLEVYAADTDRFSPRRVSLVGELRRAIDNDELALWYQPIADLATGKVPAVEALLRWNHPRHGYVPPDEFVPLAERTGLIRPLTQWVLRVALQQCAAWQAAGIELGMAVNLSVRNLLDPELPDDVARLLRQTGVPAGKLTLEITESSVMADPARTIGVLERLAGMGVRLAVDDFGTGYSSLSYLSRLPVHEVKIDKSFVLGMHADRGDVVIVSAIADLGANLGLRVVGEGVEDEGTWEELRRIGCTQAQGYFLSRPVPAAALTRWLSEWLPPGGSGTGTAARRIRRVV